MRWYSWQKWKKYPKLYGLHKSIMDFFILQNPNYAERVAFDVPVGKPRPPYVSNDPKSLAGWQYATSHRIDALIDLGGTYEIVEIKPESDISAVGQVLMYYDLYIDTYGNFPEVYPRLITIDAHPEIERLCQSYGIKLTNYNSNDLTQVWLSALPKIENVF